MDRDELIAIALALALVAPLLMSCSEIGPGAAQRPAEITQAQFEEQVEEGFGRLEALPANWAALPTR
jgi:hypothetical protein